MGHHHCSHWRLNYAEIFNIIYESQSTITNKTTNHNPTQTNIDENFPCVFLLCFFYSFWETGNKRQIQTKLLPPFPFFVLLYRWTIHYSFSSFSQYISVPHFTGTTSPPRPKATNKSALPSLSQQPPHLNQFSSPSSSTLPKSSFLSSLFSLFRCFLPLSLFLFFIFGHDPNQTIPTHSFRGGFQHHDEQQQTKLLNVSSNT